MKMRSRLLLSAAVAVTLFSGCHIAKQIFERLGILSVKFDYRHTAVEPVVPSGLQNLLATAMQSVLGGKNPLEAYRSQTGLRITCTVRAQNPNGERAVFDGGTVRLRVQDTTASAQALAAAVESFTVAGNSSTDLQVPFSLMLDNPIFSKAVLQKIARGESIPYRISAQLQFHLEIDRSGGSATSLGRSTQEIDLVTSAVPTRPRGDIVELFLKALDMLL
jgi:hypothetical protein